MTEPVVVERMKPRSDLMWNPVVRFFIGGPLDGRAIEGLDSREGEAGPMAATADYWKRWFLYEPKGRKNGWIVYVLNWEHVLQRARKKYIAKEIAFDEFEQAIGWALDVEAMDLSDVTW